VNRCCSKINAINLAQAAGTEQIVPGHAKTDASVCDILFIFSDEGEIASTFHYPAQWKYM
jgi:hypothetical protein